MYRGFKLKLDWKDTDHYQRGVDQFSTNKKIIETTLMSFVEKNGLLDGSKLEENWFPQVEADVFISHSHYDRENAISLAGWLQNTFGLKVFVDSCIWGNADDLLRLVDNHYCVNPGGETYDYEKRNESTSHVHMMLSTALSMMIDKTECLLFVNTPNSIQSSEAIDKTKSPWIYNEIAISRIIRKKQLIQYRRKSTKVFSTLGRVDESAIANYEVHLGHLQSIDEADLRTWKSAWREGHFIEEHPLDRLYELVPVDKYLHG